MHGSAARFAITSLSVGSRDDRDVDASASASASAAASASSAASRASLASIASRRFFLSESVTISLKCASSSLSSVLHAAEGSRDDAIATRTSRATPLDRRERASRPSPTSRSSVCAASAAHG